MIDATGYGIVNGDTLLVHTVGPTPESAVINWLYTEAGVGVTNGWTPKQIQQAFETKKPRKSPSWTG